jgi:hypothetical protein
MGHIVHIIEGNKYYKRSWSFGPILINVKFRLKMNLSA